MAAPTAGLHITRALLAALAARGIGSTMLTLHVRPGIFLPVKTADPRDHKMHAEWGVLSAATAGRIAATRHAGGRCSRDHEPAPAGKCRGREWRGPALDDASTINARDGTT